MEILLSPLGDAAQAAALASLTVELRFLLDNFGLSQAVQAKLASLGYTEVDIFAKLEDSAAQVRAALGSDVLDPAASPVNRAVTARILAAWEAAGVRVRKRLEADADRKVGDLPRVLPKSSVLELVRAFGTLHFELTDRETPATTFLEKQLEQLEDGELIAAPLNEVISREEEHKDPLGLCHLQPDGSFKIKRASSTGSMPTGPEELRHKVRLLAHLWEMLKLKFPARRELQDSSLPVWQRYADWLLGEDVYATQFKSTNADFIHRPAWKQLLTYEFQVRKDFSKRFNEGASIATALLRATENQAVFIKYFTTPTCLAAGAAAASSSSGTNSSRRS
eukprot:6489233-Amphidinium_carterae.1